MVVLLNHQLSKKQCDMALIASVYLFIVGFCVLTKPVRFPFLGKMET